jgi:hypothetical protein
MQFSLRAMFVATAYVGFASAAAKYAVASTDPHVQFLAIFAFPIFVGCAVGTLAGQMWRWIRAGIWADIALIGLVLIQMMMVAR